MDPDGRLLAWAITSLGLSTGSVVGDLSLAVCPHEVEIKRLDDEWLTSASSFRNSVDGVDDKS